MAADDKKWHVDKTINITSLIFAVTNIFMLGMQYQRLENLSKDQLRHEVRLNGAEKELAAQAVTNTAVQSKLTNIEASLAEIKGMLRVRPTYQPPVVAE